MPGLVTLGGSSTYCAGVSDNQTWEFFLNERLGPGYEVINMAISGGTSLEASVQTALLFSEVQPDIAVYYLGWNDATVQHVKGLRPDWSDFHGQWAHDPLWPSRLVQVIIAIGFTGKTLPKLAQGFRKGWTRHDQTLPQL